MLTTLPPPTLRICGTASRVMRMVLMKLRLKAFCQSSSVNFMNSPGGGPPALLTMISKPAEVFGALVDEFFDVLRLGHIGDHGQDFAAGLLCESLPRLRSAPLRRARRSPPSRLHERIPMPSRGPCPDSRRPPRQLYLSILNPCLLFPLVVLSVPDTIKPHTGGSKRKRQGRR